MGKCAPDRRARRSEWQRAPREAVTSGKGIIERDIEKIVPYKDAELYCIVVAATGGTRGRFTSKNGYTNVASIAGGCGMARVNAPIERVKHDECLVGHHHGPCSSRVRNPRRRCKSVAIDSSATSASRPRKARLASCINVVPIKSKDPNCGAANCGRAPRADGFKVEGMTCPPLRETKYGGGQELRLPTAVLALTPLSPCPPI